MQEENKGNKGSEEIHLNFSKSQLTFLFHLGFIILLPLIGTSVFNLAKEIYEYSQYGYYHYDNTVRTLTNLPELILSFIVSISIFNYIAYRTYNYLTKGILKK